MQIEFSLLSCNLLIQIGRKRQLGEAQVDLLNSSFGSPCLSVCLPFFGGGERSPAERERRREQRQWAQAAIKSPQNGAPEKIDRPVWRPLVQRGAKGGASLSAPMGPRAVGANRGPHGPACAHSRAGVAGKARRAMGALGQVKWAALSFSLSLR